MTISNYEYILQWVFDTAANIHYEVRATGISKQPLCTIFAPF